MKYDQALDVYFKIKTTFRISLRFPIGLTDLAMYLAGHKTVSEIIVIVIFLF